MKEYMKKYLKYYLVIIFVTSLLTFPLLIFGLPNSHDINAHMARAVGTLTSLEDGQIIPLIVPNYTNGFGYAWNLFYPPLAPYIMTVLRLFLFSYGNALKAIIILCVFISGISMFKLLEEIIKNKNFSLVGSIIYICSPYFLTNIYIRMALGEILAFTFLPILFLGIYNLFNGNGKKHTLITIGAVGILLSHIISALFAVILAGLYVIFNINKLKNKQILKKLIINILFIILIGGFFYFPLIEVKQSTNYEVFQDNAVSTMEEFKEHTVSIPQLLFGIVKNDPNIKESKMALTIGLLIFLLILITPFVYNKIEKKYRKNYLLTLIIGILSVYAITPYFPYDLMPKEIAIIQFPWRLLLIATFTLTIVDTVNLYKLLKNMDKTETFFSILVILIYISPLIFLPSFFKEIPDEIFLGIDGMLLFENHSTTREAMQEYLPNKAYKNIEYIQNRNQNAIIIKGNIELNEQIKDGSHMTIEFKNKNEEASIELPYIFYPFYEIKINDKKINYFESDKGFIQIDIPENTSGEILVKYSGTILSKVTWIISILSLIGFIIYNIYLIITYKVCKQKEESQNEKIISNSSNVL